MEAWGGAEDLMQSLLLQTAEHKVSWFNSRRRTVLPTLSIKGKLKRIM